MDVFTLRDEFLSDYERSCRSLETIRSDHIRRAADAAYADGCFWPAPVIELNSNFVAGGYINKFVSDGTLEEQCASTSRPQNADGTIGNPLRPSASKWKRNVHAVSDWNRA